MAQAPPSSTLHRLVLFSSAITYAGCSLMIEIDDERYTSSAAIGQGGSDSPDNTGGADAGGGQRSGGSENGDGGAGGTAPSGGGSSGGGGTDGTGGDIIRELPDDLKGTYYYALDETSGTDVIDQGPDAAHGITNNASRWFPASGIRGGAFETGDSDFLELPSEVASTNDFAIRFWIYRSVAEYRTIVHKAAQGAGGFQLINSGDQLNLIIGDSHIQSPPVFPPINASKWVQIVISYQSNVDGSKDALKLWVDDTLWLDDLRDWLPLTPVNAVTPLRFGSIDDGGTPNIRALFDEIRVYNRGLTSEEVMTLYEYDAP